jgi:hypothetical protein
MEVPPSLSRQRDYAYTMEVPPSLSRQIWNGGAPHPIFEQDNISTMSRQVESILTSQDE